MEVGSGDAREKNIAVNHVGSEVSGTRAVFVSKGSALVSANFVGYSSQDTRP